MRLGFESNPWFQRANLHVFDGGWLQMASEFRENWEKSCWSDGSYSSKCTSI